ncbi:MAG: adenosylcobinamide-GDP ribazoletransferase [Thiomicrorhabdus sp.]|nr:adenosylcobinamide-GDP ribazoletransferase [Thiomicrorhabdus sp.]
MFKSFWLAIQFLSRFPSVQYASVSAQEMGRAISWFPIVGGLIGLLLVVVAQLYIWLPSQVVAGIVLGFWVWSTGGLHLDGLADTADGWLSSSGNPQKALAVMKDSLIGTGGGVALVLMLILKWTVLVVLIDYQAWLFLFLAPIVGRISSINLMPVTEYVSLNGMAQDMFLHLNRYVLWVWMLLLSVAIIWINPYLFLGLTLVWFWVRWIMISITGGMTGDTAGAMIEMMELAWLMGIVVVLINQYGYNLF